MPVDDYNNPEFMNGTTNYNENAIDRVDTSAENRPLQQFDGNQAPTIDNAAAPQEKPKV